LLYFQKTVAESASLLALSIMVAKVQWIELFPARWPSWTAVSVGIACYVAAVLFMRPRWRKAVQNRARVVHLFMPSSTRERGWWFAVSLLAGFGEEVTWRGVQAALVSVLTGDFWTSAILCSVSFGLAHMIQGWKSAAIIGLFALGFHAQVWLAGSLYVAMVGHIAYDITAGVTYGRLGKELGYNRIEPAPGSVE
jgi:hypothetical protein